MIVVTSAHDNQSPSARRPTITDVARAAGVSIAVVSYALNGRPGVSAATRERVLRVADEFGWRPNAAARSMRSGSRSVGMVVDRAAGVAGRANGVLEFVTAAQDVLAPRDVALALQIVGDAEQAVETSRRWWAERRFDVMLVTDVLDMDPRIEVLRRARVPAVVVGAPAAARGLPTVWYDDAGAYRRVGDYLLALGHRRLAAVTGPAALHRTGQRAGVLAEVVRQAGGTFVHEPTAGTLEDGAAAVRRLLTSTTPPTALVLDGDETAVTALDVARRSGLEVPWDVSVVAASDSSLCRLATPSVTALPSVQAALGRAAGEAVLTLLDGGELTDTTIPAGSLAVRGSTGPRAR